MSEIIGIIGGMGPLASAEFVKTVYEFAEPNVEHEAPACVLYSDPTFPDRTECVLNGSSSVIVARLEHALEQLQALGVGSTVICCVTMHHFLPAVAARLRQNVISLIDVIVDDVLRTKQRHLLLCTTGTRRARILQSQEKWPLISPYVRLPGSDDQRAIHELIYRIKQNRIDEADFTLLESLRRKYRVEQLIAGCTEFHLLAKKRLDGRCNGKGSIQDPLMTLARRFAHRRQPNGEPSERWSVRSGRFADRVEDCVDPNRPQHFATHAE